MINDEQRHHLWRILHQVLVLLDDWFCDTFGFSRKPKGKYADEYGRDYQYRDVER